MSGTDRGDGIRGDFAEPIGAFGSSLREYAVYTLDPDGIVTSWNPGAERITRCPAAEIIGHSFAVFHTAEQIATGYPEWLLRQAAELGTYTDDGWRVRRDGSWFWVHGVTSALRSTDGTLRGFARMTRDDTEPRFRLERSLRQFRDLFELTPVAIGLFDRYGHVLDANGALCDLLGYRQEDIRGEHVVDMVHPDDPGRDVLTEAFRSGAPPDTDRVQEWSLVRSGGELVHCELRVTRSTESSGDPFWLVVFQDITERHRQAETWRYWATHDELTGLPNRKGLGERLAGADLSGLAVLYCDINKFRRINESLGHEAGDSLLVALARLMRAELPVEWLVARIAADEYVIVCPDVRADDGVEAVAARVSRLLNTTVSVRGQPLRVAFSIGVAVGAGSGSTVDDLVRFAGAAVLEAKSGGRERVSVAGPALVSSVEHQVRLEGQLREAIDADSLTLAYQPVVAADGSMLTAEALVRWPHPERGLLTPDVFLPVARQGDLLADLDRWVLRTALRDAATWPTSPAGQSVAVSVNLGELSPGDPGFVDVLSGLVAETGVDWHRIVVELVETALIELSPRATAAMTELAGRGVRFAVDDFGTGYSSLARLKGLPVQIIKIDREFVPGIVSGSRDFAVTKAITDLAKAVDCRCTAEGVETIEQFETLRGMGVDAYQGWLFSRAVSSSELTTLIAGGPLRPMDPG